MLELGAILVFAACLYLAFEVPWIALLVSVAVAILFTAAGIAADDIAGTALGLIVAPLTWFIVACGRVRGDTEGLPKLIAKYTLWTVFILALLTLSLTYGFGYGTVFAVILIGLIINYALTSKFGLAMQVVTTIGASIRQNLPLPMALDSAAGGQRNDYGRTLRRVSKWLSQGYSLSEAIKRGYPQCPGYVLSIIAAAERVNQLPEALASLEQDMLAKADESRRLRPIHPLYPLALLTVVFLVACGISIFVMPRMLEVLQDMAGVHAQLPWPTRALISFMNSTFRNGIFWLLSLGLLIVIIASALRVRFRPRRPQKPYLLSRLGDSLKWHLPILRWFEFNYSMVHTIEMLRIALRAGRPVNEAIGETLTIDVNTNFRRRLVRWYAAVERGENIATAAQAAGLGSTLAWAFDTDVNRGNTPAILETLESFYRNNYGFRVNLARFILWPMFTVVMGCIVGFVVYAMFSPIIKIVTTLTGQLLP
jgi:type IV pilus assembly protein PilC